VCIGRLQRNPECRTKGSGDAVPGRAVYDFGGGLDGEGRVGGGYGGGWRWTSLFTARRLGSRLDRVRRRGIRFTVGRWLVVVNGG
jgi:hypothetical protein